MCGSNVVQGSADQIEICSRQQSSALQHFCVCDRGEDVVLHEALIQRMIFARGVREHPLIEWRSLVPEACHLAPPCCSAALSAFTSATMSVPVPSLVNTSASTLSGAL